MPQRSSRSVWTAAVFRRFRLLWFRSALWLRLGKTEKRRNTSHSKKLRDVGQCLIVRVRKNSRAVNVNHLFSFLPWWHDTCGHRETENYADTTTPYTNGKIFRIA